MAANLAARPVKLTAAELTALRQSLSNDARVLYCLGLRPDADSASCSSQTIYYKELLSLLNDKEDKYKLGREINRLIKELVQAGLVRLPQDTALNRSFNGKQLHLPLIRAGQDEYADLHLHWYPMTLDWDPSQDLFESLAQLVGLIDKDYSQAERGEFIAYWMGRPQMQFSQFQWTQKFVFQLKQRRLASATSAVKQVGSQLVKAKAEVHADANAKKLVEKYGDKG